MCACVFLINSFGGGCLSYKEGEEMRPDLCSSSTQGYFNNWNVMAFHKLTFGQQTARKQWRHELLLWCWGLLTWFFCLPAVSRSQAQQGPQALPQLEVSEVFSRSRAAENHPSQSLSPCCALWVNISVMMRCEKRRLDQHLTFVMFLPLSLFHWSD